MVRFWLLSYYLTGFCRALLDLTFISHAKKDMSSLWPANERGGGENVLNGIAIAKDFVLITGKRWNRMYKVVFPDWPTLFASTDEEEVEQPEVEVDQKPDKPVQKMIVNKFKVLEQVPHDATSFTYV